MVTTYSDVVNKLEKVVKRLEGGELSLEESLKDFESGIQLVRQGEAMLQAAEKRVEELLAAPNDGDRVVPLTHAPRGEDAPA
ncbi:MAG: exodeoxyribonuclease VII small subunit [Myxococcaceae bacterium]